MRRLIVILLLLIPFFANPQTVESAQGSVVGPDGNPVAGAMVKLVSEGKTRVFTRTDKDGRWTLKIPEQGDSLILRVEHLSYGSIGMPLPKQRKDIRVRLTAVRQLKEVVVKARPVTVRGDTMSFSLDMFREKGDITLEESLKKVPGITVQDNGTINYLDKAISNFYIEGLDLTGGKYALATRNLPAEYVRSVEVLNRHHDLKKDKGRYSDKVALNIRLKEKVKFKPVGTSEVAVGYGDDKMRYYAGGTAMMFTPSFQLMANAKYGNIKEFAGYENREIIVSGASPNSKSLAGRATGNLGAANPPLRSSRYTDPTDLLAGINAMKKLGKDATLRTEVSYARNTTYTSSSQATTYYTGGEPLTVSERKSPHISLHTPTLELTYKLNSDELYQQNSFRLGAEIRRSEMPTESGDLSLNQWQKGHSVSVSDVFTHTRRNNKREWHLTTRLSYTGAPTMRLGATGAEEADFLQRTSSDNFVAEQSVQTTLITGKVEIGFPMSATYSYSGISTDLTSGNRYDESSNRVYYNSLVARIPVWGNYKSADGVWNVRFSLPAAIRIIDGHNSRSQKQMKYARPELSPSVDIAWQVTPVSEWTLNTNLTHTTGDALDLLTEAVQSTWRDITVKSGELALSTSWGTMLRYGLKMPFDMFFLSASAGYNLGRYNLLSTQNVGVGEDVSGALARDHTSRRLNGSLSVTKTIQGIRTKLGLGVSGGSGENEMMQQGMTVVYRSSNLSVSPKVNLNPVSWASGELAYNLSRRWTSYSDQSSHLNSMSLNGRLTFQLPGNCQLKFTMDHVSYQLPDMNYKRMTLADAAFTLRLGKSQLTFGVDNLFNTRRFDYTVFSDLDTRSYSYELRGRTAVVSLRLTR